MAAKNLRKSNFWEMSGKQFLGKLASRVGRYPVDQNFVEITLSHTVFEFITEIQDGRQKWRESDFCE